MTTVKVTKLATISGVPAPWTGFTIVGAASLHSALSDSNDGTYIESSSSLSVIKTQLMYAIFAPLALPANATIEYIQPVVRERHGVGGHLTVAELHARDSTGVHKTAWSQAPIGTNPDDNTWRTTEGPIFTKAADGVEWSTCEDDSFTAVLAWGPRWWDAYYTTIDTKPAMTRLELVIAYRLPPTTSIGGPSGTITDPRPPVEWNTGQTQEAYRLIVVPVGATDGVGAAAGSGGFEPSTVVSPPYDSGKVYSATTEAVVTNHLPPGVSYYFYVKTWAPSIGQVEMPSAWTFTGPHAVTGAVVKAPTIDLAEDSASYTVKATITRVAPGGGETAPTWFQVQEWDEATATWFDVLGAQRLSGAGPWIVFDSTREFGETVLYRARGVYQAVGGVEVPSAWVQDTQVATNKGEWWLRDPSDYTLNRSIMVASHSETIPKPQEVAYGAGARGATVTHQGVRLGVHKIRITTLDKAEYIAIRGLLDSGRSLVLVSVFGDAWRVQLADQTEVAIVKATPISGELTPIRHLRSITATFIEVDR